jgi:hypothetical protein
MKLYLIFLLSVIFFLTLSPIVKATDRSENKFGIHLAVPDNGELEKAAELVNSNGGDWGYVTIVIQENDRNHEKWQDIFNKLRELHLIPIIRVATVPQGPVWKRPVPEDVDSWVDFLNGLNWVVKDRYVILFNETNHGQEWGGSVDPVSYAKISQLFAQKLKERNKDFFVMLGGLDASAPSAAPEYADEADYLKTVIDTIGKDDFNKLFSGLSSHSYPNPGFVGSPYASGRGSVRTYEWELYLLESWGVKELPVFITETGWEGSKMSRQSIAQNFAIAYQNIWLPDDRVKAVTPFVLDYQGYPFLGFSWKQYGSDQYYPEYYTVQGMEKVAGYPEQIDKGKITFKLPTQFVVSSNYHYKISLRNEGQAIWDAQDDYKLVFENFDKGYYFADIHKLQPSQTEDIELYFRSSSTPGNKESKIALYKGDKKIAESSLWQFKVIPLPSIDFRVSLYPKLKDNGNNFEIQIFDEDEELVYKQKNVSVINAEGVAKDIRNITFDKKYRVVVLKPYYLPRQTFVTFKKGQNNIVFKKMWPLDFNKDGAFTFADIQTVVMKPSLLSLFLP